MTEKIPPKRNIYLCGFMATGKSSVGKRLASLLHYDFLDMDTAIEEESGMSIPQIFSNRGEAAFRAMESRMVEKLAARSRYVIATGGGVIVNARNIEILKHSGIVVTLTADIRTILSRVGSGEDRPMLKGNDLEKRTAALMEERAHAYAQADMIIDTSTLTIDEVAQHILTSLEPESEK
jgi:shikimate kinase